MIPETVEAILDAAIELFRQHDWCKSALARDSRGDAIYPADKSAVAFCVVGAIRRVSDYSALGDVAIARIRQVVGHSASLWNDLAAHKDEVIEVLQKAKEVGKA